MTQASELALHDKHLCKKLVLFFQRSNTLKKQRAIKTIFLLINYTVIGVINRSNFNPFKVISLSCHWAFQFNTSNNQSETLASVFYNLEINVRTLIRITICHGCQSVNPGPHLSACTLLKWTNYRSTSATLVRRGVIPNLALVIGTCAFLHSHWSIAGFEPRSTVPVQSVVPSLTLIVHND